MHKLGIIVPYRDRFKQLQKFLKYMPPYLAKQNLAYEIIVVEQADDGEFNRGALLNAGFLEAKKRGCDYVVFHDVDLLPRYVDYSYSDVPLELVGKIVDPNYEEGFQIRTQELTDDYFGGVTMFPVEAFEKINGYSNKYVGWGFEDNDLLLRCREALLPLGYQNYRQYQTIEPALTFDGAYSYVRIPVVKSTLKSNLSFLVTFKVDNLRADKNLPHDECAIFCIPGLDTALCYESFGTYKFEFFDNYEDAYSIHTKKYPIGMTIQAVVTLDFKARKVRLYMNGKEIGSTSWPEGRRLKFGSNEIYLGVGHPTRRIDANSSQKWFKGQISDFAIFPKALTKKEVLNLYGKSYLGLGQYNPVQWYSAKVVTSNKLTLPNLVREELTQFSCNGDITECKIEPLVSLENFYRITAPIKRPGVFVEQPHATNGTEKGYWKSWATRENQIRYQGVDLFGSNKGRDGLSSFPDIAIVDEKLTSWPGAVRLQVRFKKR